MKCYFKHFIIELHTIRKELTISIKRVNINLLSKESRNEVFNHSDVNLSLKSIFLETPIAYKRLKLREIKNNRWLSKGLINSSKRMKILNNVKRRFTLMNEALKYIKNIKKMCKRVLKEAKNKRQ